MTGPRSVGSATPDARRRVLHVPMLFHPEPWNGIMEHLQALLGRLDRERVEPQLGTRPDDGTQTATLASRVGVDTVDLGLSRSVLRLREVFRRTRPDIVHVHTPSTSGLSKLVLAARLAGVPRVIVTLHQVAPDLLPHRSRLVNRGGQRFVDVTIAVSSGVADTQSSRAGLTRRSIHVVPNGVEDAVAPGGGLDLPRRDGQVWVGYVGRLAEEKGIDGLIRGVAEARSAGTPLNLLVVGDGYERPALESLAAELACAEAVHFTGYRADARALMAQVDVVAHVPPYEGFGLVVAEAMAAGRPVIGTDVVGGIPDMVVPGETGLLVPYGDVGALAAALRRLGGDASLRATYGRAARARYEERFTVERMVDETAAWYDAGPQVPWKWLPRPRLSE